MTLPNPTPSSPQRNPVEHLYFTVFDPDNEQLRFVTHAFGAHYAAAYWLQYITSSPAKQRWIDSNHLELEHDGYRLLIKGSYLEDNIERKLTKAEQQWTPPYPDNVLLEHLRDFHIPARTIKHETPEEPQKAPVSYKAPNRHRTVKAPDDESLITVAQLAQEANIPANKARQILRKNNIQKPGSSWTYNRNDPQVQTIKALFKT